MQCVCGSSIEANMCIYPSLETIVLNTNHSPCIPFRFLIISLRFSWGDEKYKKTETLTSSSMGIILSVFPSWDKRENWKKKLHKKWYEVINPDRITFELLECVCVFKEGISFWEVATASQSVSFSCHDLTRGHNLIWTRHDFHFIVVSFDAEYTVRKYIAII